MSNLLKDASILLTPTAYNVGSMLSIKPTSGDGDFTFSRNGDASRVNSSGIVVAEGANLPRINYEGFSYDGNGDIIPDSGCGIWLLEPQSTNLITQSELFSDNSWIKNNTAITSNYSVSPSGILNASRFLASGNAFLYDGFSVTIGADYTISFWVKSNGSLNNFFLHVNGNNSPTFTATDVWQRFEHTFTAVNTSHNIGIACGLSGADVQIWGAQLEQQSYATSYIPTSGASNTRLQDLASGSGNASLINSTEGVLYAEIAALENTGESIRSISLGVNGDNNQTITIRFRNQSNTIGLFMKPLSPNNLNLSTNTFDVLNFNKIALKYKSGQIALWINGSEVITSTNTLNVSGLNYLSFNSIGVSNFYGKVKAVAVYKEALTDAELQSLTTI
tara:strand:+ start:178 stop:1350 length:1173 start_codon:yes stop_codon:yes gene_type:complete